MSESLSKKQARKLVLHAQQLPSGKCRGSAEAATFAAVENLGYVQIDTISVIQRAHHHVLWGRNPRYKPEHLDQLLEKKRVFEYWSHAAAYLPMRDYRYSLLRKHALKTGKQSHWFRCDEKMLRHVLDRITAEGSLMARDFDGPGKKAGGWGAKPMKQALETLFMQGDLMILRREKFHKVYDLTERVLPAGLDRSVPTEQEYIRFLIFQYLEANGLGQAAEIAYLLKHVKPLIAAMLQELVATGEVVQVKVGEINYFALPSSLELLSKPLNRRKLIILSPFDNLLIQRKRMKALFDFDYQIECYVPAAKRKYGYFVLPILWDGKLVARMDCRADRKTQTLNILNLVVEPWVKNANSFFQSLEKELPAFMAFNACSEIIADHKLLPGDLLESLRKG